ncbi:MAG TPA: DegT/DnrJ/EryC1/StrS family aminotransferase [Limnochordales bacterium]|nr:DegT/DnrJ/EryC1/StrS family aminotransferase [Limnochordales bacterium]
MIRLAQPQLGEEEIQAVQEVLRSGQVAAGPQVHRFEEAFAAYVGVRHAVAVANGTVALHAALLGAGVQPGDRVVTTPFTFVATANAILYCGAVPVFADIDPDTYNLSPAALTETLAALAKAGTPAKAVLLVHLFGLPCDMGAIAAVAAEHGALLIEDCAQAHGAAYNGRRVGTFGVAGTFSFYATKNMTTGEGGMVVTDSDEVARRVRQLVNHGRVDRYEHAFLGYNYRMTDVAAAIGLAQLAKLDQFNLKRRAHAVRLSRQLSAVPGLVLPVEPEGYYHVYHQYTVRHPERDALARWLREQGVETGVIYPIPLHQQPLYREMGYGQQPLPHAEAAAREVLSLPVHPGLSEQDVQAVAEAVRRFVPGRVPSRPGASTV